ncbi:hypothetical protein [Sinomicrobium sp.]
MKNTKLSLLLFSAIAFMTLSCSDDENLDSDGTGDTTPEQNLRLSKYSDSEHTTYTFSYNSDNFLVGYENVEFGDVYDIVYDADNRITQIGQANYVYNSEGQIVSMNNPDDFAHKDINADFTYNEKGLISECAFEYTFNLGEPLYRPAIKTFEYDSEDRLITLTVMRESDNPDDPRGNEDERYFLSYDDAGNVTDIRIEGTIDDGEKFYEFGTISFTYDDKINPSYHMLSAMGVKSNLNLYPLPIGSINTEGVIGDEPNPIEGFEFIGTYIYSPNNVISASYDGDYELRNLEYQYNEFDLPVSAVETIIGYNGEEKTINHVWEYESIENQREIK